MSSGGSLGLVLLLMLLGWGVADIYYAFKDETFSEWITKKSKASAEFTMLALVVILGGALLLVEHFDLFDHLRMHVTK